jgi:acetoin utilization deacetylase AcuC-like enzyme
LIDVHQGNGTPEIFQNNRRFYLSTHGKRITLSKETSDLDIAFDDGNGDAVLSLQL